MGRAKADLDGYFQGFLDIPLCLSVMTTQKGDLIEIDQQRTGQVWLLKTVCQCQPFLEVPLGIVKLALIAGNSSGASQNEAQQFVVLQLSGECERLLQVLFRLGIVSLIPFYASQQ